MFTPNDERLMEVAFPLKQTSLDSVHEKNMRYGHISTLHVWSARGTGDGAGCPVHNVYATHAVSS